MTTEPTTPTVDVTDAEFRRELALEPRLLRETLDDLSASVTALEARHGIASEVDQ